MQYDSHTSNTTSALETHEEFSVTLTVPTETTASEERASALQNADSVIRALIFAQTEAWNQNDAVLWASAFTDDASFINVRGEAFHGRDSVEQLHMRIFSGPYRGSHSVVIVDRITHPASTVAIVETTHEVTDFHILPPGVVPTILGTLRTRMKYIFVLQQSSWRISAAQNTAVLPQ